MWKNLSELQCRKRAVLYFFLLVGVLSLMFYLRMFSVDFRNRLICPDSALTLSRKKQNSSNNNNSNNSSSNNNNNNNNSNNTLLDRAWRLYDQPLQNRTDGKCLKNYFKDVILIIVYHYQLYDTIPSVTQHYKDAFPHIVVCGPNKSDKFDILAFDMGPGGYYCYECLGKAMQLHPGYRGYLFVNDDMVVNWWNFAKFDKDKIWQGAIFYDGHEVGKRPISEDWFWWTQTNGLENCERTYKDFASLAKNSSLAVDIRSMLENHRRFARNKTICCRMLSDFVYIPGRLSREFKYLCSIFFKNKVFLEIAVPTIMTFLEDSESWEKVFGIYLPNVVGWGRDFSKVEYVWPYFTENVHFLHPVKIFGDKGFTNRKMLEGLVRNYVNKYISC